MAKITAVKKAEPAKKSATTVEIRPVVRLAIEGYGIESKSQYGRGIANLCQGVRELGSLNAAAKGMGMAYSKAWRIVKDTEAALGLKLLIRDGAHGSHLTDKGNELLDAYLKLDKQLQDYACKQFAKLFQA